MIPASHPISRLAPALLLLGSALAAVNWYVQPERALAWSAAMLLLISMGGTLVVALRWSNGESERHRSATLGRSIVFASLIVAFSLGAALAGTLGAVEDPDLGRRATMAILGAVLVFTGNAMPKTLTPLSALQCEAEKVQTFQRLAGWTWVLSGLGFAIAWLTLPIHLAAPVSLALVALGMLGIAWHSVRLCRMPRRESSR